LVDAENMLLYNLGPGYLASAARSGVRFVRTFTEPPAPPVALASRGSAHYLEYGFTDPNSEESTRRGAQLASWHDVPWPDTSAVPKVSALWFALRASHPSVYGRLQDPRTPFGVRMEIEREDAIVPVRVLKPLLDAVISAFHLGVKASDVDVATYVAEQVRTTHVKQIDLFLADEQFNVLGSRVVVSRYRNGVKWNPADERCVFAQIVCKRRSGPPTFSGELFATA
jgi:hypothetical protein